MTNVGYSDMRKREVWGGVRSSGGEPWSGYLEDRHYAQADKQRCIFAGINSFVPDMIKFTTQRTFHTFWDIELTHKEIGRMLY